MTTSFHSPLTIHRENTRLPLPSLHVSPRPVTLQGQPGRSGLLAGLCGSPSPGPDIFVSVRASSTRCLPVSLVLEGILLVVLPREMLCQLYFTSYRLRNLRNRTQKGLVTDAPRCPVPALWPLGDCGPLSRGGSETQATRDCRFTFRMEPSCTPLWSYFPQVMRSINSSAKF